MAIKNRIRKMGHYKPPIEGRSLRDYLLLDFNERTIEPSQKVKEALKKFIGSKRLQVYPEYGDLEAKIGKHAGVKVKQVMVTNGADQGIDIICRAHLDEGDKVIIPFPSFAMHYQSAGIQGAKILEPRYGVEDGSFPFQEVLNLLEDKKVRLVIICNPNNPLGVLTPIADIEKILRKANKKEIAVLHDEACFDFCGVTAKDLIDKYDNLYIVRTFAKVYGLPALRAGYVLSKEENIQELKKIRGPYDVNMFAKTAILAALEDSKYVKDYVKEVIRVSKPKLEEFLREKRIFFYPSVANFLLLKVANPREIIEKLKQRGILVRPKPAPDGKEAIRVTIGTLEDTERFIKAFDKVLTGF